MPFPTSCLDIYKPLLLVCSLHVDHPGPHVCHWIDEKVKARTSMWEYDSGKVAFNAGISS